MRLRRQREQGWELSLHSTDAHSLSGLAEEPMPRSKLALRRLGGALLVLSVVGSPVAGSLIALFGIHVSRQAGLLIGCAFVPGFIFYVWRRHKDVQAWIKEGVDADT